jgi:RHS repeat-associated protein
MKTQMKPSIWFLTLLALLTAPHLASAYYDPGVQRWINRDPVQEPGFELVRGGALWPYLNRGAFQFVENDPLDEIDPLGLSSKCQSSLLTLPERADKDSQ